MITDDVGRNVLDAFWASSSIESRYRNRAIQVNRTVNCNKYLPLNTSFSLAHKKSEPLENMFSEIFNASFKLNLHSLADFPLGFQFFF